MLMIPASAIEAIVCRVTGRRDVYVMVFSADDSPIPLMMVINHGIVIEKQLHHPLKNLIQF